MVSEQKSWSSFSEKSIRNYSCTAVYTKNFKLDKIEKERSAWIRIDSIFNIASIKINGIKCGTLWTKPYIVEVSKALRPGENNIEIEVSNTWMNRLIGDQELAVDKRVSWTTAPFRLKGKPLLPAGITGNITLIIK